MVIKFKSSTSLFPDPFKSIIKQHGSYYATIRMHDHRPSHGLQLDFLFNGEAGIALAKKPQYELNNLYKKYN